MLEILSRKAAEQLLRIHLPHRLRSHFLHKAGERKAWVEAGKVAMHARRSYTAEGSSRQPHFYAQGKQKSLT